MDLGVTIGASLARLETVASAFDFVEYGLDERADVPGSVDVDRLRSGLEASEAELCVHLPFKQVVATPVPEINDSIVTYQTRLLEWAGDLDAQKAVLHGTVRNPHDTDLRPVFGEQLDAIVTAGADAGVEVVVENVGHQPAGLQLTVLGDVAREVDAPVCFDVGHAFMEDGMDGIDRFCKRYGDLVSHLHVHDARRRGDTHLPVGAGEIDYDVVRDRLGGFEGTVAVEVFTDDLPLLEDTAERIESVLE